MVTIVDQPRVPKLFDERAAAEALGVSVDTLRRERKRAKIAHTMIGGRIRYTEAHLTRYIEETGMPDDRPRLGEIGGYWLSQRPTSR